MLRDHILDLYDLRFVENWTLAEIAGRYGVSSERVRQLVGNGQVRYKNQRVLDAYIAKNPTADFQRIKSDTGFSDDVLLRYGLFRGRVPLHAGRKAKGQLQENKVYNKLASMGIRARLMPNNHPFDILIGEDTQVEVKSRSNPQNPKNTKTWVFNIRHTKRYVADFYICVIVPYGEALIIPGLEMGLIGSVAYVHPKDKKVRHANKWDKYLNAWHLLAEQEN